MTSEVGQATGAAYLEQFRTPEESKTAGKNELGKDEFLNLLVTQLENQNPLEPQDNGEFIAQLAQFSSLEGIDNLNDTMTGFVDSFQSNQALEASMLVGREVQIQADSAWMQEGQLFTGAVVLPVTSGNVNIGIYDEKGVLVRSANMGAQTAGNVDFGWDGKDSSGNSLPSGTYTVKAEATIDGQTEQLGTLLGANVNSVTLGTLGKEMTLNLNGIGPIPMSQVTTIQ
jgi:flagellar basal-body rod modification protein FlgD